MLTFIRIALFIITLTLGQIQIATILHDRGILLTVFGNQPHRSLGMLYTAHILQPHRSDFAFDYVTQVLSAYEGERLIEGQRVPVVPMECVTLARQFPNDPDFQKLRRYVMWRNLKGDYDNMHGFKEEEK